VTTSRLHHGALALVGIAMLALLPAAGAGAAQITGVTPAVIKAGKPTTLALTVAGWQPGMQVALVPDSPYRSHRLALAETPRALAAAGRFAYVATAGGSLQVAEFPAGAPARRRGDIRLSQGEITALTAAGGRLLASVEGFGLVVLDVSDPAAPRVLGSYATAQPLHAISATDREAYLLLGEREVVRLDLGDAAHPRALARWRLPLPARSLAVRGAQAVVAGAEGVGLLALGTAPAARLLDRFRSSGHPRAVNLQGERVLVDDDEGGMVVLAVADGHLVWQGSHNKRGAIDALAAGNKRAWVVLQGHTLLSLGLENPQLPSSGPAYYSPEPVLAVSAAGGALIAATSRGVARIDFGPERDLGASPGLNTGISPQGVNLGGSRRGVIRDDILYVADWFSGLHLYDISEPTRLRHLGNYHTPGSSKGVALKDHYALVGDDDQGLQIIDIADPRHPRWVSGVAPSKMARLGLAYTMKVVGDRLYLADHRGGFHIIDLSDIRHPRRLGGFDTPSKSWAIDVVGPVAYVADDSDGLLVFDVSDPAHPTPMGNFNPGGTAEDVVIRDGLAYVAFFQGGFYILDISDPRRPREVGHLPIPGNARGIQLVGDLAYVTGWESGLQIVDIHHPAAPHIIGAFDTRGSAWGVNVAGNHAFVLDWWGGIKVLDVSDPSRPRLLSRYHDRGTLQGLRAVGKYLYAASGAGGLQVFDIKNPLNPIWATTVDLAGEARDVWSEADKVYVAAGDGGVAVLDARDPFYTHQLGVLDTPGEAYRVRAYGDTLFIADSRAGLLVADARAPRHPRLLARYPYRPRDLWLDETGLYLAEADGVRWLAVGADGRLTPKARLAVEGGVSRVRGQGALLAALTPGGEVRLLRRGRDGLQPLGRFDPGEAVRDMQLLDDTLYLVGERSGLMVVDVQAPERPQLTTLYPAGGYHTALAVAQGSAFLAGETRVASVKLLPAVAAETRAATPQLRLPAGLPAGRYQLLLLEADGRRHLLPAAFEVRHNPANPGKFNLEAIRHLLKTPLKPPPAP
jgi:hypothetical protein